MKKKESSDKDKCGFCNRMNLLDANEKIATVWKITYQGDLMKLFNNNMLECNFSCRLYICDSCRVKLFNTIGLATPLELMLLAERNNSQSIDARKDLDLLYTNIFKMVAQYIDNVSLPEGYDVSMRRYYNDLAVESEHHCTASPQQKDINALCKAIIKQDAKLLEKFTKKLLENKGDTT